MRRTWARAGQALGLALLALAPRGAGAQDGTDGIALRFGAAAPEVGAAAAAGTVLDRAALEAPGRYVVIHLAENRAYVLEGRRVLWSAPVATGTGFRLEHSQRAWKFGTPRGVFRVERKEKDPVWVKPDWAYIEEGQPVPSADAPDRRQPGTLGTTALYIGYELAMHGTDHPDLVLRPDPAERRVSHGCIRFTNEDARELYYLVDVGTPVLIY